MSDRAPAEAALFGVRPRMRFLRDPDGKTLILYRRYARYPDGSLPVSPVRTLTPSERLRTVPRSMAEAHETSFVAPVAAVAPKPVFLVALISRLS